MLKGLASTVLLASLFAFSPRAFAEPEVATESAAAPEVRRDPRGVQGISPFTEALKRGDRALLSGDFEAAIAAYREAIAKEPVNALGHYRAGEAQILKGDLHEAELSFSAGLRVVAAVNPRMKAKLQFALADLRERQKAYDEASAVWAEYEAFTTAQNEAQGFLASASERKKVLFAWKKLRENSLEVKSRIEKGLQDADDAVKKSSK